MIAEWTMFRLGQCRALGLPVVPEGIEDHRNIIHRAAGQGRPAVPRRGERVKSSDPARAAHKKRWVRAGRSCGRGRRSGHPCHAGDLGSALTQNEAKLRRSFADVDRTRQSHQDANANHRQR